MSPRHVVLMGVSGTGKSAVAEPVAAALGAALLEGDDLHPPANVAKMRAGTPLTDEDRAPWLAALAGWTRSQAAAGRATVVTCSALRRRYRDVLRTGAADTFFVHLSGDEGTIRGRMETREHFMPASLLRSQLATLEPLEPDEAGVAVPVASPLADVVAAVLRGLGQPST